MGSNGGCNTCGEQVGLLTHLEESMCMSNTVIQSCFEKREDPKERCTVCRPSDSTKMLPQWNSNFKLSIHHRQKDCQ
uniref:Stc1 domain-containing protein n=1 Tax=Strongyloides papillosus TaxID=174720 RepID=A0A0N5BPM7_STREA